jgi:hypothetical protein
MVRAPARSNVMIYSYRAQQAGKRWGPGVAGVR